MNSHDEIRRRIDDRARALQALRAESHAIASATTLIADALRAGGRILTCGNGGSAAEALHLAEELVGRFKRDRRPLGAVCLAADPTALTCIANDYGFEQVFARQLQAIGGAGDVLVALTTSGRSANVLRALETARDLGIRTIGLLGLPGSAAEALCDVALSPQVEDAAMVQELHLMTIHIILESLDAAFAATYP